MSSNWLSVFKNTNMNGMEVIILLNVSIANQHCTPSTYIMLCVNFFPIKLGKVKMKT